MTGRTRIARHASQTKQQHTTHKQTTRPQQHAYAFDLTAQYDNLKILGISSDKSGDI